jgi:isoleucyl-tRNA synthetase
LYFVLKTLTKIMAPFVPFTAEDIWLKLRSEEDEESVHLTEWPEVKVSKIFGFIPLPSLPLYRGRKKEGVLEHMETVRKIVTLGLEARQKAGLKVRQPLASLEVKDCNLGGEYIELIKDELNVKEVKENKNLEVEVLLDMNITGELKQEGDYREFVRAIQDMRKKMGLTPSDVISLTVETNDEGKKLIQKFEEDLLKIILASKIKFEENNGEEIKIDTLLFKVKIEK